MLAELSRVLERPKFTRRINASGIGVNGLIDGYAAISTTVRPEPVYGIAPDPDDDVVIGTALAANAAMIVTGDHPFLGLKRVDGIPIVTVAEAVATFRTAGILGS
jgi:uncharacterized protein